jgi:hypothetical protein
MSGRCHHRLVFRWTLVPPQSWRGWSLVVGYAIRATRFCLRFDKVSCGTQEGTFNCHDPQKLSEVPFAEQRHMALSCFKDPILPPGCV